MTKTAVLTALQIVLAEELEVLTRGARASFAAATDPDSKAENKYDTRTLEASYVARGQAQRVAELQEAVHQFQALAQQLTESATIRVGSLVTLNDEFLHFLGPAAGGTEVTIEGQEILVITPASPLGQKLMGKQAGDTVEIGGGRSFRVSAVV
ncbi:GreA/GreB family transcription elongation factor [Prosthecobacter fusiformis]|uniref:GreA/GreB family transcription elongation factor n=1 Tax=Prosthecobacter fusiformis TaxID=48464 RepID=A0A4V3FG39_9BACT|nr:GreA/GreB family elongation factor [Prosthecobacter fusiformis]TDU73133.1 GreA/GreB family transcription elongation factor [Prosthecobacter fusiformis]